MKEKVSIIIPNYNRGYLIKDTLKSIKNQKYLNWECIVVDDRSTDNSKAIIQDYIKNDERYKLVERPLKKPKGANSCRNYGFELSKGFYIHWFDSDDLMTPDHIDKLVNAIRQNNVDFAVGDSINFVEGMRFGEKPYIFDRNRNKINPNNFGKQTIGWITDDFLGKREILENIQFNEKIKTDGDEYNFFTRLLHQNHNGIFLNEIITHRRIHEKALSNNSKLTKYEYNKKVATIKFLTFRDLEKYRSRELALWFLLGYMRYSYKIALEKHWPPFFLHGLLKIIKNITFITGLYYVLAIICARGFGKGYIFYKKATKNRSPY